MHFIDENILVHSNKAHSATEAIPNESCLGEDYVIARIAPPEGSILALECIVEHPTKVMDTWQWTKVHIPGHLLLRALGGGRCAHLVKDYKCSTGKCYVITYNEAGSYARWGEAKRASTKITRELIEVRKVDPPSYGAGSDLIYDLGHDGRCLWRTDYDQQEADQVRLLEYRQRTV